MSRNISEACTKRSQWEYCIFRDDEGKAYCPCCGKTLLRGPFHRHHAVPHFDGGLSARWNVVAICKSCHVVLHNGAEEDQYTLSLKVTIAMAGRFGLLFLMQRQLWRDVIREVAPRNMAEVRRFDSKMKRLFIGQKPVPFDESEDAEINLDKHAASFVKAAKTMLATA